jgi:hypothetical protein
LVGDVAFTQLFNATGNPAMSVPLHWSAEGLPVGVQFVAPFGDEATSISLSDAPGNSLDRMAIALAKLDDFRRFAAVCPGSSSFELPCQPKC